jgi:hypothetical protein
MMVLCDQVEGEGKVFKTEGKLPFLLQLEMNWVQNLTDACSNVDMAGLRVSMARAREYRSVHNGAAIRLPCRQRWMSL